MKYRDERQEMVTFGKKMMEERLTTGTGGNLSLFIPEDDCFLISPSGVPYHETELEDIVVVDLEGEVIDGKRKPSSEIAMHQIFYQNNPAIRAVVHTHSEYATTFACLRESIQPLHYIIASVGEEIRCSGYETYGTEALAKEAYRTMQKDTGILLANHGVLTVGESLSEAFSVAKDIEFVAKLYYRARAIGKPVMLSTAEIEETMKKFGTYGQG